MAAKIVFLLALLISPSVLQSQIDKPSFSIKFKTDKLNYGFGEDIKIIAVLKNISVSKDSISPNENEDLTSANLKMFHNDKLIECEIITSHFVRGHYLVLEPGQEYQKEIYLNYSCGAPLLGGFSYNNILDTGFYSCFSYLSRTISSQNENPIHEKIKSNEVYFTVNLPDSNELKVFAELKSIFDFSIEHYKDKSYKFSVLKKLDNFVRNNINSYFSDIAFRVSASYSLFDNIYDYEEGELSKFYIENKFNGPQVNHALFRIYNNEFNLTNDKKKSLEKIEAYIEKYAGTEVETEAKKLIQRERKQKEEK